MKTPKEEADDLFNSMKGFRVKHSHSKKCAKVAIQLLFDAGFPGYPSQSEYDEWAKHWNDTLTELEKL